VKRSAAKAKSRKRAPAPPPIPRATPFPIVGIGASAGGLEAFSELLRQLPEKTGMAFVLVQHLDPKHPSDLQAILARTTKIPVQEVADGIKVEPDRIYVIPPNSGMAMKAGTLRLEARALTRGQHMPIDHFLRSLAEDRGNQAISVVLSGTASDGTEGSRAIKAAGGITFAQDEKSAKYSSMPHSAVHAGCVDFVLPPAAIAKELARVARHPFVVPAALNQADLALTTGNHMGAILSLLHEATGVDFTHYKQTTLQRRIKRRMVLHKVEKLKEYVRLVRDTPGEVEELYQDILIHVTGFFRDPEAFEGLRKHVFPDLFGDSKRTGTVRVWVPGCSTGEEVYSLAMAMLEYVWLETTKTAKATLGGTLFQIFATDISDTSLDRARAGLYAEALMADVSPERLRRFFVRLDGGYQIAKPVREMCIFAKQNVAKDPPFSNLDLVSCRNLLIYLGPVLQKRVVPSLHYALKPSGYLMLGEAESLGTFSEYFTPVDKKNKIYKKKESAAHLVTYFGSVDYGIRRGTREGKAGREPKPVSTIEKEADRMLMDRFVPASIVVNEQMEIVQFRGKTGPYLEPAAGQPTFNLSKMAREGLLVDLRAALTKVKKANATVRKEGVLVQSNGHTREVNLEVSPVPGTGPGERFYLVVFQDAAFAAKRPARKKKIPAAKDPASQETARLRRELEQIREQFQTLIEEHETVSEEFKSANEEVLSANEELQSTNEELETAKEELQSTNEELTTLNEELQNRNLELTAVNNDLLNLLGNVTIPVVIVGQDLHIRRFTPPAQKLLNLLPSDVGRRLSEIRPNLDTEDLGPFARESIDGISSLEREVREKETGAWYQMRVRPYKTWDSKIDGAVISFQDIDDMKRNLDQMHGHADALIENAREAILVLDGNLQVISANLAFCRNFAVSREETQGSAIYDLGNGQWNIPKLRELLENILPNNGRVEDFEVRHDFPRLGTRRMMLNAGRIQPQPGQKLILLYIEDVTGKT
jgi:two-component system, chemotaxis family, CheB/CheR fusion protein